jgi:hypothetical protein
MAVKDRRCPDLCLQWFEQALAQPDRLSHIDMQGQIDVWSSEGAVGKSFSDDLTRPG